MSEFSASGSESVSSCSPSLVLDMYGCSNVHDWELSSYGTCEHSILSLDYSDTIDYCNIMHGKRHGLTSFSLSLKVAIFLRAPIGLIASLISPSVNS